MPLAVYGGKREVMECVAPLGSVYQAGTLSGNPVAVTSGRNHQDSESNVSEYDEWQVSKDWKGYERNTPSCQTE